MFGASQTLAIYGSKSPRTLYASKVRRIRLIESNGAFSRIERRRDRGSNAFSILL